jgi:hypothetical protein
LLRTGFLMTGNAKDAEDLVQETLLKVARRWNRVRSMDHPAAYARRPDRSGPVLNPAPRTRARPGNRHRYWVDSRGRRDP